MEKSFDTNFNMGYGGAYNAPPPPHGLVVGKIGVWSRVANPNPVFLVGRIRSPATLVLTQSHIQIIVYPIFMYHIVHQTRLDLRGGRLYGDYPVNLVCRPQ